MTLLTCVFAAIICSILWYKHAPDNTMRLGTLSLMYWGASLMWLGDAIFEYAELHEAFFTPEPIDMLNDFYLGLSVVALGLIIWLVILLVKDLPPIIANTVIVPFVLRYGYGVALPIPFMMLTVGVGEVVGCGVLGLVLYTALNRYKNVIFKTA